MTLITQESMDTLEVLFPYLRKLENVPFECFDSKVEFQANKQDDVKRIREVFHCPLWRKEYKDDLKWWEYFGDFHSIEIRIYAVYEAPKTCTPVYATRVVKKQVPVQFEERDVEETYISGYNCGDHKPDDAKVGEPA